MSDELRPCPWCDHAPEVHEIGVTVECAHADGTRDAYEMVAAGCVNEECPVMPCAEASGSPAEAAAKWNARVECTCRNLYHVGSSLGEGGFRCSLCDAEMEGDEPKFCPSCGAKVVV